MKRIKIILLLVVIGLAGFILPMQVLACKCVEQAPVELEFDRSNTVFSGTASGIRDGKSSDGYMFKAVLFDVSAVWKGLDESQVIIATGQGDGDCGIDFKIGEEYLVYATESTMYGEKQLVTVICDRTKELSSASEDLAVLGDGKAPSKQIDITREFREDPFDLKNALFWSVAGLLGIVITVGYVVVKKKK